MTFRDVPLPIPMCEVPFGANVSTEPQPVPDAHALLSSVAAALTACEAAGIPVKLKHGAVMTDVGYVLPLGDGQWGARTLVWTEFSPSGSDEDED